MKTIHTYCPKQSTNWLRNVNSFANGDAMYNSGFIIDM